MNDIGIQKHIFYSIYFVGNKTFVETMTRKTIEYKNTEKLIYIILYAKMDRSMP